MGTRTQAVILIILMLVAMGAMFNAGYNCYKPAYVFVDRWHQPQFVTIESVRYEPLPDEIIDYLIVELEWAGYTHQNYLEHNPDASLAVQAFHEYAMTKNEAAVEVLKVMLGENNGRTD